VVLYFGNRLKTSEWLSQTDLGELAAAETVIGIRVPKPEEEPKALPRSRVPANRLAAADLWVAYGVTEPDLFIVCDKFGNEYRRTPKKELADLVKSVAKHFREQRAKVKEHLETATKARTDGKTADALAALHKALKLDIVGYDEAEGAIRLYREILEDGRKQLAAAGKDSDKLAALAKLYAGSDLEAEIAESVRKSGASG
jgi:hypothetical protein